MRAIQVPRTVAGCNESNFDRFAHGLILLETLSVSLYERETMARRAVMGFLSAVKVKDNRQGRFTPCFLRLARRAA